MNQMNEISMLEEFFQNGALIQPSVIPQRLDLNGRWYEYNGEYKPSMTTILDVVHKGIGYDMWLGNAQSFRDAMDYANERADVGSRIHTDIARLILGYDIEIGDRAIEEIRRLFAFRQFWQHYTPRPITIECPLFSSEFPFAGTVDLVARVNYKGEDEVWLCDWKTGNVWPSAKYQLSGYKYLFEATFGITVDRLAIVQLKDTYRGGIPTAKDKPKYNLSFIDPIEKGFIDFLCQLWKVENGDPKPKIPEIYPSIITLSEENDDDKGIE